MVETEKSWRLKSLELNHCPVYRLGESIRVKMPEVQEPNSRLCAMPVVAFLPHAITPRADKGTVEAGFRDCSCKWEYCPSRSGTKDEEDWMHLLQSPDSLHLNFFQQIPPAVGQLLIDHAFVRTYSRGKVILHEKEKCNSFNILQKGKLRMANQAGDGQMVDLQVLHRGDCFGEVPLLTGLASRYRIEAISDCTVLSIPGKDFLKLLSRHSGLGVILFRILAQRLQRSQEQILRTMQPGVAGDLRTFGFIDLAQTISSNRMTGTLYLHYETHQAFFGFIDGQLQYGQAGPKFGLESVKHILRWKSGTFRFQTETMDREPNMSGDTMGILLETVRRMDETTAVNKQS